MQTTISGNIPETQRDDKAILFQTARRFPQIPRQAPREGRKRFKFCRSTFRFVRTIHKSSKRCRLKSYFPCDSCFDCRPKYAACLCFKSLDALMYCFFLLSDYFRAMKVLWKNNCKQKDQVSHIKNLLHSKIQILRDLFMQQFMVSTNAPVAIIISKMNQRSQIYLVYLHFVTN